MSGVALLVGIPWRPEDVNRACSDYATRFRADSAEFAAAITQPVTALVECAQALDVRVYPAARLDDVKEATGLFDTAVIVLSHWKGPHVAKTDVVVPDAEAFRARLAAAPGHLASRLLLKLAPAMSAFEITTALNEVLCATDLLERDADGFEIVASPVAAQTERREILDTLFVGLLRPGNRIELAEGLHSMSAFEASVATGFSGTLDLSTCTSLPLADFIERKRHQSRRFRVVLHPKEILPEFACAWLELTLDLVIRENWDYIAARDFIGHQIEQQILALPQAPKAGLYQTVRRLLWKA